MRYQKSKNGVIILKSVKLDEKNKRLEYICKAGMERKCESTTTGRLSCQFSMTLGLLNMEVYA